jgi:hypothetical protein
MASFGLIGPDRKPLFNIGRIPGRQSAEPVLARWRRQILPPGRKGGRGDASVAGLPFHQAIEIKQYFLEAEMARSLLTGN